MPSSQIYEWFVRHKETTFFSLLYWSSIGTWQYTDSLTIQLPFMLPYLPEGWDLGVFFGLMSGLSNISLVLVPLCMKIGVKRLLILCYFFGLVFSIALIFLWDKTIADRWGHLRHDISFGFMSTSFVLLALDGLRGTLLFSWIERDFPASFVTAILVGEVSGGFIATLMSYIQGARINFNDSNSFKTREETKGSTANVSDDSFEPSMSTDFIFGPTAALSCLSAIYISSTIAFTIFLILSQTKFKMTSDDSRENKTERHFNFLSLGSANNSLATSQSKAAPVASFNWFFQEVQSKNAHKYFMWIVLVIAGGNLFTFSPSFFTYTSLPYSQRCYTLSVSLWGFCLPTMGIVSHFKPIQKFITFVIILILHLVICTLLFLVALRSPNPPFVDYSSAEAVISLLWMGEATTGYFLVSSAMHCLRGMEMENAFILGIVSHNFGELIIGILCFCLLRFTNLFDN